MHTQSWPSPHPRSPPRGWCPSRCRPGRCSRGWRDRTRGAGSWRRARAAGSCVDGKRGGRRPRTPRCRRRCARWRRLPLSGLKSWPRRVSVAEQKREKAARLGGERIARGRVIASGRRRGAVALGHVVVVVETDSGLVAFGALMTSSAPCTASVLRLILRRDTNAPGCPWRRATPAVAPSSCATKRSKVPPAAWLAPMPSGIPTSVYGVVPPSRRGVRLAGSEDRGDAHTGGNGEHIRRGGGARAGGVPAENAAVAGSTTAAVNGGSGRLANVHESPWVRRSWDSPDRTATAGRACGQLVNGHRTASRPLHRMTSAPRAASPHPRAPLR